MTTVGASVHRLRSWAVAVALLLSTLVAGVPPTSMEWPGSQTVCADVAVTVAVNPDHPPTADLLHYRITAGHSHGPPVAINGPAPRWHTYYVMIGNTPVLVHNSCSGYLGDDWVQRPTSEITGSFGCEACADDIIARLGGGERIVVDPVGTPFLGTYRGVDTAWGQHTAVLFNGRVYDAFSPAEGVPLVSWLGMWGPGAAVSLG